jgi:hypothetical protein
MHRIGSLERMAWSCLLDLSSVGHGGRTTANNHCLHPGPARHPKDQLR